jgi:hypothetical protein
MHRTAPFPVSSCLDRPQPPSPRFRHSTWAVDPRGADVRTQAGTPSTSGTTSRSQTLIERMLVRPRSSGHRKVPRLSMSTYARTSRMDHTGGARSVRRGGSTQGAGRGAHHAERARASSSTGAHVHTCGAGPRCGCAGARPAAQLPAGAAGGRCGPRRRRAGRLGGCRRGAARRGSGQAARRERPVPELRGLHDRGGAGATAHYAAGHDGRARGAHRAGGSLGCAALGGGR